MHPWKVGNIKEKQIKIVLLLISDLLCFMVKSVKTIKDIPLTWNNKYCDQVTLYMSMVVQNLPLLRKRPESTKIV